VNVGRRALLRVGVVTAVAAPVAGCTAEPEPPPPPDPLAELAAQARADAGAAQAVAAGAPALAAAANVVAAARGEHATVLQSEVDRERPPATSATSPATSTSGAPAPPADPAAAKTAMVEALAAAEKRAAELVPTLPRYRAGLVGSVAAGCASLREGLA
jgi:hypothetical protein